LTAVGINTTAQAFGNKEDTAVDDIELAVRAVTANADVIAYEAVMEYDALKELVDHDDDTDEETKFWIVGVEYDDDNVCIAYDVEMENEAEIDLSDKDDVVE